MLKLMVLERSEICKKELGLSDLRPPHFLGNRNKMPNLSWFLKMHLMFYREYIFFLIDQVVIESKMEKILTFETTQAHVVDLALGRLTCYEMLKQCV